MITVDSIIEKLNHKIFLFFLEKDDDGNLVIYSFNGSPYDADLKLATLNIDDLVLDIVHCSSIHIGDRFSEGFAFEQYDWSDLNEFTVQALLESDISEEQFFEEIISYIPDEIEEEIEVMSDHIRNVNEVTKRLAPIVKQQTKEATK